MRRSQMNPPVEEGRKIPFAIYDPRAGSIVHLGLYDNPDVCWTVYLGRPSPRGIEIAKARGLVCVAATITYDPRKTL